MQQLWWHTQLQQPGSCMVGAVSSFSSFLYFPVLWSSEEKSNGPGCDAKNVVQS